MTTGHRSIFACTVLRNDSICREHYRLVLGASSFPATRPGQFVQVSCRDMTLDRGESREMDWEPGQQPPLAMDETTGLLAFLRRPFSLAGRVDTPTGVELHLIQRVVGIGTDWLAHLAPGKPVSVLGPLGNGFELPAGNGPAVLVGGGVGIPPMLYLAEALQGRRAVAFCGATTRDLLPLTVTADAPAPGPDSHQPLYNITEFAASGVPAVISTDDGSYGFRGFVTQALERYLDQFVASNAAEKPTLYTCGPEPMMKRVADIAIRRHLPCQVAVERAMACGMGTCQSCVIRLVAPNHPDGWVYKLACTDGPVFAADQLLW